MGIANCTSDDIGSDVGHPGRMAKVALSTAIALIGGALLAWSLIECSLVPGLVGAGLLLVGAVALDRTLREGSEVGRFARLPLGRPGGPSDQEQAARQATTAAAAAAPTVPGACAHIIPAMSFEPFPTPFAPGSRVRLCNPDGQVFAEVEIGAPSSVSYLLTGADETSTVATVSHIMVEGSMAAGYQVTLI